MCLKIQLLYIYLKFTAARQDQHCKQKVRSQQFSICGSLHCNFSLTTCSVEICTVVCCSCCTNLLACVVVDIASTLLSLSSMRKSNRETYGTCLKHNKESRIVSLAKHLLEGTVLLADHLYCLESAFWPSLSCSRWPSITDKLAS